MTERLPEWLKRPIPLAGETKYLQSIIHTSSLNTVCEEARCPNRGECFCSGTATFMILGNTCTRTCRFCSVRKGMPSDIDQAETDRLSDAVAKLKLRHVVLTMVTRDDLPDGGAAYCADTVRSLKERHPDITVELLASDFAGNESAMRTVLESGLDIIAHNVEMVSRLYPSLRPQASYRRSLNFLSKSIKMRDIPVKTGIMVGLGETNDEVCELLQDIAATGAHIVTIGQYLRPGPQEVKVHRFVTPEEFRFFENYGYQLGIPAMVTGPFVRSSYRAVEMLNKKKGRERKAAVVETR